MDGVGVETGGEGGDEAGLDAFGEARRGEFEFMEGGKGFGSMRGKGGGGEASSSVRERGAYREGVPAGGRVGKEQGWDTSESEIVVRVSSFGNLFEQLAAVLPGLDGTESGTHHDGSHIGSDGNEGVGAPEGHGEEVGCA